MASIVLPLAVRIQLPRIYKGMDDGSGLCIPGCYKCCKDPRMSLIEFCYLISGVGDDELRELFSKDGPYCPFVGESGKCLQYEQRPWICRDYRKVEGTDDCLITRADSIAAGPNAAAYFAIKTLNREHPPRRFARDEELLNDRKLIKEWFKILFE